MKSFEENCEIGVKLIPFKVLTVPYKDGFQTLPHWHKSQEMLQVVDGAVQIIVNNTTLQAKKGDVILINAFDVHALSGDAVVQVLQFEINRNIYQIDAFEIFSIADDCRVLDDDAPYKTDIEREMRALFRAYEAQGEAYEIYILGCIYKILHFVSRLTSRRRQESVVGRRQRSNVEKLNAVLEYVETHFDMSISIDDVSRLMCLSPNYFCRFFKSVMGLTFFEYLNMYRCDKAEYLLKFSDKSVTEVAFATGFSSVQYFNRVYKQYKEKRPSDVRKWKQSGGDAHV